VPRLTIVIPCLGGAAEFDGTLVSVLQHRPADCEIVVVHREAYDDPYDLAGEVRFIEQGEARSIAALASAGLAAAQGDVLHLLSCGLEATEGWTDAPLAILENEEIAAVSPAIVASAPHSPSGERLLAAGIKFTSGGGRRILDNPRLMVAGSGHLRAEIAGPTLLAGFYRVDVLSALQGWSEAVGDELADVDLSLAIEKLELRAAFEPSSRLIHSGSPAALLAAPEASSPLAAGRASERLFWVSAAGEPVGPRLLAHVATIAWDLLRHAAHPGKCCGRLLGRLAGLADLGSVRRWEARLQSAAQALAEERSRAATIPLTTARTHVRQTTVSATPSRRAA
jgi:hypothetical protein